MAIINRISNDTESNKILPNPCMKTHQMIKINLKNNHILYFLIQDSVSNDTESKNIIPNPSNSNPNYMNSHQMIKNQMIPNQNNITKS